MRKAKSVEHVVVSRKRGQFAGWPANYGMWGWGAELLVVFTEGVFLETPEGHKRDRSRPFSTVQGRSLDNGRTWEVEPFRGPTPKNRGISADEHMVAELGIGNPYTGEHAPGLMSDPLDFTDPETIVMVGRTTCRSLPDEPYSWFHVSHDRCRSWQGPYRFVGLDQPKHLASRTDIVSLGRRRALFMLTCHKSDGREGRVFCAETLDGGISFRFVSWVGEELREGYEIMPSTARRSDGSLVCLTRFSSGGVSAINAYESLDEGATWSPLPPAVECTGSHSNPPCLVTQRDGRLCLIYGFRDAPSGIRGKLSSDGGRTWCDEIVLRSDGGDFDLGYPRAALDASGQVVTTYYLNTDTHAERFIGATIWDAEAESG